MGIEIVGEISDVSVIAIGRAVRRAPFLRKVYGGGRWRKLKGIAEIRMPGGHIRRAEVHWYEAHGVGRKGMKIKRFSTETMPRARKEEFAICIHNDGCEDLEVRKVYQLLPDATAAAEGYVRVVDESGEDYLYPEKLFVRLDLPEAAQVALRRAVE